MFPENAALAQTPGDAQTSSQMVSPALCRRASRAPGCQITDPQIKVIFKIIKAKQVMYITFSNELNSMAIQSIGANSDGVGKCWGLDT